MQYRNRHSHRHVSVLLKKVIESRLGHYGRLPVSVPTAPPVCFPRAAFIRSRHAASATVPKIQAQRPSRRYARLGFIFWRDIERMNYRSPTPSE